MTKATDIASIVKPLGWNKYNQCISAFGQTDIYETDNGQDGHVVWVNNFPTSKTFKTVAEAKSFIFDKHCEQVLKFIDTTKIQPQPKRFWKPISECPKDPDARYTLWLVDSEGHGDFLGECKYFHLTRGWAHAGIPLNKLWPNSAIVAYAEIPPYEVQS